MTKSLKLVIFLASFFLLSFTPSRISNENYNFCGVRNYTFKAGETVKMKVYYSALGAYIGAGEATFSTTLTTYNGKPAYHFVGAGKTFSFFDNIFKVRDRYESYVDTTTMLPYRFERNIEEGKYKKHETVTFDHNNKKAITNKGTFNTTNCIQDVVSAVFYARNIDYSKLKKGDRVYFDMFLGDDLYHLYIRYMGVETVKTQYGKFRAIRIRPLLVQGDVFKGGEEMDAWFTDDYNRLLVRVQSPISVGSVKVDMMSYSGLRHPLTSLKSRN